MRETFNASEWLLDRHVDGGRGDAVAIRSQGGSVTYAGALDLVKRTAAGLRALGVRPEDRVAMAMFDSVEFVAAFLGAMRIGAVPVPMNPLLPARDLGAIVADARARILVVSDARSEVAPDIRAECPELEHTVVTGEPSWTSLTTTGDDDTIHPTWPDSPGFWLCTSGSTGQPKLAMHRHIDIKTTCDTYATSVLGITPDDRCFSVGPMFHAYGLGNSLTFPFSVGASTVLEPTRPPNPQLVHDIVTTEQPSLFFCVPTFFTALNAAELPDDTFAPVRLAVSAAEPLPAETFHRFGERFGTTILDGIGSTEMLHIYVSNTADAVKAGTSGLPVTGYEVKLLAEDGNEALEGEPGELIVRGDSATTGYYCRTDISRATIRGEWIHTGDLYDRDTDGFYTYLGRVDDMLRVGGEWVSPAQVEAALMEHADVLEAAVVGERDERDILRPIAFVIPSEGASPDTDALTAHCRDQLAPFKVPRRFEFVTELPKTATGKIQRFKLRG